MRVARYYTKTLSTPYADQRYVERTSSIRDKAGSQTRQLVVVAPEEWSRTAVDILAQKYMRRTGVPQTGAETDARQVFDRIATCWTFWGRQGGYFETDADAEAFRDEMAYMLAHQIGAPNSPQWFNTGLHHAHGIEGPAQGLWRVNPATGIAEEMPTAYAHPLVSACFIQSVDDSLVNAGGIMDLWVREARLFKFGSGSGSNFSALRGRGEALSGGGTSSGLMSWLKIGDRSAGAIKSGGTTRRAAKMVILNLDHPDIEAFIQWKVQEEKKVAALMVGSHVCAQHLNTVIEACWLREEGREQVQPNPRYNTALNEALRTARAARVPETYLQRALAFDKTGTRSFAFPTYDLNYEGEAYDSVSGQNANNSVRIPNTFFAALDAEGTWDLRSRTTGEVTKTLQAQDLWNQICAAAWQCADPGLQFDDIINDWHTTPAQGRIHGSNPCVTGDTLVATSAGWQRIAQLVGTTPDIIDDNQAYRATQVFPTGRKSVYLLTTTDGYQLRLTADHRIPTVERGEVEAQWLRPGDELFLRGSWFGASKIDEKLAFAIGAAVGDGCLSHYAGSSGMTNTIILTMHRDEAPILRDIADFINQQKTYAKVANGSEFRPVSVWYSKTGSRVACAWPPMVALFQQYAILDKGSQHKRFTDKVFDLDKSSLAALLRGLFTTDGTVANCGDKCHYISLDSSSLELLQQVQVLLLSFRIKSKLYRDRRAGKLSSVLPDGRGGAKEYPVQEMHSLRISRHSRLVFGCHIGFHPESAKHKALRNLNKTVSVYSDRMHTHVESIECIGEEEVYDLTQPATHHFIGNGIRIHNCSEYYSNDNTACNLASLNLVKFLRADGTFDLDGYQHAIACWTVALDITVFFSAYPSRAIAERTYELRQLGLGYANLGAVLMRLGLPYDSPHGRAYAAGLTAIMTGHAYARSALLAKDLGPFAGYAPNR
jgi:ribonucleoside-diphosphate reductase alpha chain